MLKVKILAFLKIIGLAMFLMVSIAWVDTTGSVRGLVRDPTGAVIAGATIEIRNPSTNEVRTIQSGEDGQFSFASISVGTYILTVETPGFQPFKVEIKVNLNQTIQVTAELQIATDNTEIVQVTANPETSKVETVSTQLGNVMESKSINELPLNGRDVYKVLLQLQPGVMSSTGSSTFVGDDKNLSVNGNRGRANNYTVNGGDANDPLINAPTVEPPPDAIEEFKVITNTFDAEYGRNSGSVINLVTKSGTNNFHGSVFEYFGNTKLNARGFFDPPNRPQYNSNQYGFTLGGPIKKDKQFFFITYQGTRLRRGITTGPITVFTAQERQGFFAPGSLGDEFPNGNISTQIDPLAAKLLQFIPLPNQGTNTFISAPVRNQREEQVTGRYDIVGQKHHLTAYYYFDDNRDIEPISTFQNQTQTSILPGFGDKTEQRSQNINLTDTWIISPTTVNEARFNFVRQAQGVFHSPINRLDLTAFGFTGITPGLSGRTGLPYINVGGNFILGNNFEGDLPQYGNTFQLADSISIQKGNHTLKFGSDFRRVQLNQTFFFAINGVYAFTTGSPDSTGNALADFLLGRPDSYLQGSPGMLALRAYSLNFFGQDSWRIRPNLTFNYGLRWEFNPPAVDTRNRIQAFREGQQSQVFPTAPTGLVFPGDTNVPRGLTNTYYRAFAPRLGLAFTPNFKNKFLSKLTGGADKTSIRAGFAIAYNAVEQLVLEQFTGQPPFGGSSSTFGSTFSDPFLLRDGTRLPNPFPVTPATPGSFVDFSKFSPTTIFGQINPNLRPQYSVQYNLSIQRQIKNNLLLSITYVGLQAHRLLATYDLNPGIPSRCKSIAGCGPFGEDSAYPGFAGTRKFSNVNFNGNPYFSSIFTQDTIANSNYNSLQVNITRSLAQGFLFDVAYTFSKSIDNASSFEQILNPFDYKLSRSLSQFDARHRISIYAQYDLPLKKLFGGGPDKLVNGWQLNSIITFQSGFPIRLADYNDASLTGGTADFETADTPDNIAPVHKLDPRKNNLLYFDPASFASIPASEYGRFGTAGRQFFSGPGVNNCDLSLIKKVPLTESRQFEIRWEVFNLFNHTQFLNPDGFITDGDRFGKVFRSRDPRMMQIAVKFAF